MRGIPLTDVWVDPDFLMILVNGNPSKPTNRELCLKAGVRAILGFDADETLLAGEDGETVFETVATTLYLTDVLRGGYAAAV
ncbi:hypothetical protein DDE23_13085 [Pararhodobacter aggregans]|uniref:Uncharacterized protein n=1 Tax=Pararhodobacter aggregans TaxID=404875 RepID=A0A2T7UR03_9RHOB|nr:hypothetical protein DDE23_13085 [Pararhodobacter aggregans]